MHMGPKSSPETSQRDPKNLQNGGPKPPKWRPKPSKIEPKWRQEGARRAKKSKNNIDPTKKGAACHSAPPFWRKMWPTWPQLGSQDGAKMEKKSMQKSIKKSMPFKIDFWSDFGGFWEGKGTKLAPKWDQKSMLTSIGDFSKNLIFPKEKQRFLRFNKSKLGATMDQKSINK